MTDNGNTRLIAEGIGVRFGGLVALSNVDLEIGSGEIVGLIGANGAGKSTLINVMSGFQKAAQGHVRCGAQSFDRMPPQQIARAGVVRTFQAVRLFAGMSVSENVAAAAAVVGAAAPPTGDLLDTLGLKDHADMLAGSLSYANQRRLAIARALALSPRFLLLDEPAAGMTPDEVAEIDGTLVAIRDRTGLGLLLVEHNMTLVMSICERLVVLDTGQVIARGTPHAVQNDPDVRRAYLGSEQAP